MGQKINPIGLRLGINRGWDSTWFAKKKDFGKYLIEDFKIRNYIKKNIYPLSCFDALCSVQFQPSSSATVLDRMARSL